MTLNDQAWEKLFNTFDIVDKVSTDGYYLIDAKKIKTVREPRLMTKFDHRSHLPAIFTQNQLSILPTYRGGYIISNFETFYDFEEQKQTIKEIEFPTYIESLAYNNITSEAIALNCALIAGMIEDFTGDAHPKLTVNGRMSSSSFDFDISKLDHSLLNISVNNAQLEIDGGYEGYEYLTLVEAKNSISKDFMIRQVYYPYRLWQQKLNKKIKNVFLTYSNGIFHFREYVFENPTHFNSIRLVKSQKYSIRNSIITLKAIEQLSHTVSIIPESQVPFPQADSFDRLINLCELLNEKDTLTREDITRQYDFNIRQSNYYASAGMYLGLIAKDKKQNQVTYFLTTEGQALFELPLSDRQLKFMELILSHQVFKETIQLAFKKSKLPSKHQIVQIMKHANLYNVNSESTYQRRASTIIGWINWILEQASENSGRV